MDGRSSCVKELTIINVGEKEEDWTWSKILCSLMLGIYTFVSSTWTTGTHVHVTSIHSFLLLMLLQGWFLNVINLHRN